MPRKFRNTIILAKIETTIGTDAVPTGAANAILAVDPAPPRYTFQNVDRNVIRGYYGAAEQLVGSSYVTLEFGVELAGSGTAGTAPAWGALLQACAMAEVVTAGQRVEYNPVSTGLKAVTIYYHVDGVLHKALGCMGTVQVQMEEGSIPQLRFTFTGIYGGVTSAANPTGTYTAWSTPQVVDTDNSGLVTLGGSYSAGAISGGTTACSRGLTFDLGNQVSYQSMLGPCSGVEITNRAATGSVVLDLDAAGEVAAFAAVNANTLTSIGMQHGSTAGNRVLVFAPAAQRVNPTHQDNDGRLHLALDLRLTPVSGNDELRIVAL